MKKSQLPRGVFHVLRLVQYTSSRIFLLLALLLLSGASVRAAIQLATVVTLPATGQSNSVATLNGTVNPNGSPGGAWFNWGLGANNYNQKTAKVSVGNGNAGVAISNALSGLTPGMIYHGQASGTNAATGVIVNGTDVMFGSPAVTLLGAATITNALGALFSDPGATASDAPLAISAGAYHSLALKSGGTVAAWGAGTTYNPNDGSDYGQSIIPAGLANVTAIAGGEWFSMALKSNGKVVVWGRNDYGQTNVPAGLSNVVVIAAGAYHSLALKSNGRVVAWGRNTFGQTNVPAGLSNVMAIAGGGLHSLALKSGGTVVAWGENNQGQANVPAGLSNVVAIAAGEFHSLALKSNGTVVAWGYDGNGQINVPAGLSNVVAIAGGWLHNLALKSNGTVVAWGDDFYGQTNVPAGLSNVVAIAAGESHSLALKSDGTIVGWGRNNSGQTNVPAGLSTLAYTVIGSVNTNVPGTYTLTYAATNSLGGVGSVTRTVVVPTSYPSAFLVSAPANVTAGVPFDVTVTAVDQFTNVVTGYTGTVSFASSDASAVLPANSTLVNGVGTFSATLATAGNMSLSVVDTVSNSVTGSTNVIVAAGPAVQFLVAAPPSTTAGVPLSFTVTAVDQFTNVVTDYTGTVGFGSGDTLAVLPANTTLVNGSGTFSATLATAGTMSLTATDTSFTSITGSANVLVAAGPVARFVVAAPANTTAGTSFNFSVTAVDQFANVAVGYTGTVGFGSSDAQAVLPANSTLVNGVGSFSARLKTAGSMSLTATDTSFASVTGSANVTVAAGSAMRLVVSTPANATAGTAFNFTVTALDCFQNVATTYAGTVGFGSSDTSAVLPANSTLANGVGSFSAKLKTAGLMSLTATDTVSNSITGSANVTVAAGPAMKLVVSAPANATAGTAFNFTVTALDCFQNVATTYAGTVGFGSSDTSAVLPANSTLANGVGSFSAKLKTAGLMSLTATDTVSNSITGSANVTVAAGPAMKLVVSAPANATAGTAFNFTVTALDCFQNVATSYAGTVGFGSSDTSAVLPTALDCFQNVATSYAGTVGFGSSDALAVLPANSTLVNGSGTFSATLGSAGTMSLTSTDTVSNSITGSANVIVAAGPAVRFLVCAPTHTTAGVPLNFTIKAVDQFTNIATGYAGTVGFGSSDALAVLPANSTLANGVGTFSATLETAGLKSLTATDTISSSITGSANVKVAAGQTVQFLVGAPTNTTAGVPFDFTVTAVDQFTNITPCYTDAVSFASSDALAVLPGISVLTNGGGTFSATLATAGTMPLSVMDIASNTITGSTNVIVIAGPAVQFLVSAPANTTAGVPFDFTVTAVDQFTNVATGYTDEVNFASSDALAVLPGISALTNGVGTFTATLAIAETTSLSVADTVSNTITGGTNVIVTAGPAVQFLVSAPANTMAGMPFNFTVTAVDQFTNVATSYAGTVAFGSSDTQAVLPANSTLSNGVGTFSARLKTAGGMSLTSTDTVSNSITGSANVTVAAGPAMRLVVGAPANATAGTAFNFTVTAVDCFQNVATSYAGTVGFGSSDALAALPANSTLVNGVGTFSATLDTAGLMSLSATDTSSTSITGSAKVTVADGSAVQFLVCAPTNATAGTAFNFIVKAVDQFTNIATGYTGTVHFASSDALAVLPADSTLANGVGKFSATLDTAGLKSLTATDTSITGSANVTVVAGPAMQFLVCAPANATAGTAFNFIVKAVDQFTNIATGYAGTVHFGSSDTLAVLPGDSALANGVAKFSATLDTAGIKTLTATDTLSNSITGSANVTVAAGPAVQFLVCAPAHTKAGDSFNFTVKAVDQFTNIATAYAGTVHFGSSDALATLPADSTLANGVGKFSATLDTAGLMTLSATDTVSASITGSTNVKVAAGQAVQFLVGAPTNTTAGVPFDFTVTAVDQFTNVASCYTDTVSFASSDALAVLPGISVLTNGAGTFSATLITAGTTSLSAVDTISNTITGSTNVIVIAGPTVQFLVATPTKMKARIPSDFSVTAQDQYGNTAVAYAGLVHFTGTDGSASLPVDSSLTNGLGVFSATMQTAGMQTLTGTDTVTPSITGTSAPFEVLDLQIVVQPANQYVFFGSNALFSVGVSGTAPFAYQWFVNGALIGGATNDTLTVPDVTLTTAADYQVVITNCWGSVTSSVALLQACGMFAYQTNQTHTAVLNPLTGLYEERVVVTNTAGPISGVQILVGGLPSLVSLENAAGTNNGKPYAQFNVVMQSGTTNTFVLQFLNTHRLTFTNTIDVVALTAGTNATPGVKNSTQGIPISQVYTDTSIGGSPRFTLAFASTPGQSYQVFYSDDGLQTWQLASTVTATSTWTIWTEVLPPAQGSRFFKVIPFSNNP